MQSQHIHLRVVPMLRNRSTKNEDMAIANYLGLRTSRIAKSHGKEDEADSRQFLSLSENRAWVAKIDWNKCPERF